MSLDVLFQQILRSEQKAEDRRTEIVQVNSAIMECNKKVSDIKNSISNVKQKLKSEDKRMLFVELAEVEVLTKQSESLTQQQEKLKKSNEQLKDLLKDRTEKSDCEFNSFMDEVDAFVEAYSFSKPVTKHFQRQQLDELENLKKQESIEKLQLEKLRRKEEQRNAIIEHHACLDAEVSHLRTTIIDLDSQLEEKRKLVLEKRAELEAVPSASVEPEYCRLQAELQSIDSRATEAEVMRLRNELAVLQSCKK